MAEAFLLGIGGGGPSTVLSAVTLSSNGTYYPSQFSVDGFNEVTVNVTGSVEDGDLYLYHALQYVENSKIATIKPGMFYAQPLTKASFLSANMILSDAFKNCILLSEINISSTGSVLSCAFENCMTLKSFVYPNVQCADNAFSGCCCLYELSFSTQTLSTAYIYNVNYNNTLLSKVYLHKAGVSMANQLPYFLSELVTLENITLSSATMYKILLNKVSMPNTYVNMSEFTNCYLLEEAQVSGTIDASGFYVCQLLSSVTIFSSNITIGIAAFVNCFNLSSISMPSLVSIKMSQNAFVGAGISEFSLSISSITMSTGTFSNCNQLSLVSLPATTNLGTGTGIFYNCYNLETVNLQSLSSVYGSLFLACYKLQNVYLSNCISISNNAFMSCKRLSQLMLNNCTSLYASVFSGCVRLYELYLLNPSQVCTIQINTFNGSPFAWSITKSRTKIYVPSALVDTYKTYTNWVNYSDIIEAYSEV